jgi:hypothetical protein
MSILSDFEDRIGGAVEGLFAGAFRSPVQPAEIAKALSKAMDDERMVGIGKVYAPVAYDVVVSPEDGENLRGFVTVLAGELATYLTDHARERGYHLGAKPVVTFLEDDRLRLGRFRVEAEHAYAEGPATVAAVATVANVDFDLAPNEDDPSDGPAGDLDTLTVGETHHDVVLRGDRMVIGRVATCDICLADQNASRRHAELLRVDDSWVVRDLESTNGTRLNGRAVKHARLEDGDVIEIGVTRLTYHRVRG